MYEYLSLQYYIWLYEYLSPLSPVRKTILIRSVLYDYMNTSVYVSLQAR